MILRKKSLNVRYAMNATIACVFVIVILMWMKVMNDFTKDELQKLAYGLECCGLPNSDLRLKVLSMIDNYCEHEPDDIHEIRTDYLNINKCIKCGEFYR